MIKKVNWFSFYGCLLGKPRNVVATLLSKYFARLFLASLLSFFLPSVTKLPCPSPTEYRVDPLKLQTNLANVFSKGQKISKAYQLALLSSKKRTKYLNLQLQPFKILKYIFFTGNSFWDRLCNFLHKFTWIVLSVHKLNKLGKFL